MTPVKSKNAALVIESTPDMLRSLAQWVCWRYEASAAGTRTKIPYDARNGHHASSTEPTTWTSFDQAVSIFTTNNTYDGVGYVFSGTDGMAGLDLDDCIGQDGVLAAWAKDIVEGFASYTEISPSGRGLKVFLLGRKPAFAGCAVKGIDGGAGELEVYDKARYFCVTGNRWPGTPAAIVDRQIELDALCNRYWAKELTPTEETVQAPANDRAADCLKDMLAAKVADKGDGSMRLYTMACRCVEHDLGDAQALATIRAYAQVRPFPKDWTDDEIIRRIRDAEKKCCRGENSGRRGTKTNVKSGLKRGLKQTHPPKADTRGESITTTTASSTPIVLIDTDEHRVVSETIQALKADTDLYQRGTMLVRVLRDDQPNDGIIRPGGSPTIQAVPSANLRDRMTRFASFAKANRKNVITPAHPAPWLVSAVEARASWPGIRRLAGVSDTPVLRADGSVWQTRGYDSATGVLFETSHDFPIVHPEVGIDDAVVALDTLSEVICDFRFESEQHKSAWLAALLTPLARFAFDGPSPLFLIDANVRGAGKGLLAQTVGRIVLGREMPVSSYAHDAEEMRKRITAIAIAGDRTVLLDNLEGTFGNDALDRALTSTRWKDRILGRSEEIDLPLLSTWYATGNNVAVAADTARRIIHIRLDVLNERPEERTGFRHPNLTTWIGENRQRLLTAALTILSAYCKSGRPAQKLTAFGSFEGWSSLVREALVWVGVPDPCQTRTKLTDSIDTTADTLSQLIAAWRQYDHLKVGVVVSEMLNRLYPSDRQYTPHDAAAMAMRMALENLVGCPPGKTPTPRQVGNRLRQFRRRVIDGVFLDTTEKGEQGAKWRLHAAQ